MKFVSFDNKFIVIIEYDGSNWYKNKLIEAIETEKLFPDIGGNYVEVRKAFYVSPKNVLSGLDKDEEEYEIEIQIGIKRGKYWEMDKEVLGIAYQLYLGVEHSWSYKHFVAEKGVKIFPKFNGIVKDTLKIGGDKGDITMPFSEYDKLVRKLPSYLELSKYVKARLSMVIGEYFDVIGNAEQDYERYLNRKIGNYKFNTPKKIMINEGAKFKYLISKLSEMLKDSISYSEDVWQGEIVNIIKLLFPKYVASFEKINIKDTNNKKRQIDIGLIDVEGNIDIIEIKKPFDKCIMSNSTYRDNFVPLRELSGAVMQAEKYIMYLQRGGTVIDKMIQKQFLHKIL